VGSSVSQERDIREEILMNHIHLADLLIIREKAELGFYSWICYSFQDKWELAKFGGSGICEVRESGGALIRESQGALVFVNEDFGVLEEAKSKTSLQKSGFKV
jgi:hypothetical protein